MQLPTAAGRLWLTAAWSANHHHHHHHHHNNNNKTDLGVEPQPPPPLSCCCCCCCYWVRTPFGVEPRPNFGRARRPADLQGARMAAHLVEWPVQHAGLHESTGHVGSTCA